MEENFPKIPNFKNSTNYTNKNNRSNQKNLENKKKEIIHYNNNKNNINDFVHKETININFIKNQSRQLSLIKLKKSFIRFNFLENLHFSFFGNFYMSPKMIIFKNTTKKIQKYIDINYIIDKLREFKQMKRIIFDKKHRKVFNYTSKLSWLLENDCFEKIPERDKMKKNHTDLIKKLQQDFRKKYK